MSIFRTSDVKPLLIVASPAAFAAALVLVTYYVTSIAAQPKTPDCVRDEDRVYIRRIVLEAVDEGFKAHIRTLFTGWIKDPTHQPQRASAGLNSAIVAYQQARGDALTWNPVSCEGGIKR